MTDNGSNHAPLIPMSEMFGAVAENSRDKTQLTDQSHQQQLPKKGSTSYSQDVIDREIANLDAIQSKNNEEIKKRLTEIQSLRENNLVVVGALGGLKKIREQL